MLHKLPVVIAVELIIGVIAFLFSGDKASFIDIALVCTLLSLFTAFSYYAFKRINNLNKA